MPIKGIENHKYTNRIIKWLVVCGDFVVLWALLYWVAEIIPHSDRWDDDKCRTFWMVCTLTMIISEYCFSTIIHLRLVGGGEILRRNFMLVATQTLLSYLALRAIHFTYRFGWQLFLMGISMFVIIVLLRYIERWMLKRFRKLGYNTRKVTIVGADPELHRLYQKIISNPTYGYKLRSSYVSPSDFASLLSHPEDLHLGDEVYLCVPRMERQLIERTASLCYRQMIKFYYVPVAEEKLNLHPVYIDDMEVLATYTGPLEEPLNRMFKRGFDILFSILFLIPTSLMLPFIAIIIKCQSPGPVFIRQLRTGLGGQDFYCLLFRSLHTNAANNDSQQFPFGKFMRRTRIDKLPMFWNVLVGDMSVVGPRPHKLALIEQYDKLADKYMLRHFVKPGITGWAQVTGFRGEVYELSQMEGRIERDIWYIQHWSFWLDLRIIWLTFKTIFKRDKNAY